MWHDEEQKGGFFVFRQATEVRIGLTLCETGPELHLYEHPLEAVFIEGDKVQALVLVADDLGFYLCQGRYVRAPVRSVLRRASLAAADRESM